MQVMMFLKMWERFRGNPWFLFLAFIIPNKSHVKQNGEQFKNKKFQRHNCKSEPTLRVQPIKISNDIFQSKQRKP